MYEWDKTKRAANIEKHRIDFEAIHDFDWSTATVFVDERQDYGEPRFVAFGYIKARLVAVVYTERSRKKRIISMRKANNREVNSYG